MSPATNRLIAYLLPQAVQPSGTTAHTLALAAIKRNNRMKIKIKANRYTWWLAFLSET